MSNPKLKNYTTTVPAEKSISEIEHLLLEFGAENFMKKADKEKRQFTGIMFTFEINDKQLPFKLPANVEKVCDYLYKDYLKRTSRPRKSREDFEKDAYNIAWRLIKDWVHAQLSIITTEMVQPEEVFMPYLMVDGDITLSQKFIAGDMNKMLPEFTSNKIYE